MDVEREFERFVETIGEPEAARDEHRRKLRKEVIAAVESAGPPEPALPPNTLINTWKSIMHNRTIRWFTTAAILLICVGLAWFYAVHAPSAAWADVHQTLDQAQSLSLRITVYQGDQLRNDETMLFLRPDLMRVEANGGSTVFDWKRGKMLSLLPKYKQAIAATIEEDQKSSRCRQNWFARLKAIVGDKTAEQVGVDTFGGRPCKGWRISKGSGTTTVWADAKTAEVVRVEMDMKGGAVRTILSDIQFNPKLDESLFSLDPPEGYDLTNMAIATKGDSLDGLLLLLRAWSGGNGGVFPDTLTDVNDWFQAATKYDWSKEAIQDEKKLSTMIGKVFFSLNENTNWVYRGKGVKVGEADRAVFWQPIGRGKYRVIYGDFSVREVDKSDLPE